MIELAGWELLQGGMVLLAEQLMMGFCLVYVLLRIVRLFVGSAS